MTWPFPDRMHAMPRRWLATLILGALLLAPSAVLAQVQAWTNHDVNVRAGPDRSFPLVTWVRAGTPVTVVGCLDDRRWCDVIAGNVRGWAYAGFLEMEAEGARVVIRDSRLEIVVPILSFVLLDYWDHYYRSAPWWSRRHDWDARPHVWVRPHPPARPPSRPPTGHPSPPHRPPAARPPESHPNPPQRPPGAAPHPQRPPASGGPSRPSPGSSSPGHGPRSDGPRESPRGDRGRQERNGPGS